MTYMTEVVFLKDKITNNLEKKYCKRDEKNIAIIKIIIIIETADSSGQIVSGVKRKLIPISLCT